MRPLFSLPGKDSENAMIPSLVKRNYTKDLNPNSHHEKEQDKKGECLFPIVGDNTSTSFLDIEQLSITLQEGHTKRRSHKPEGYLLGVHLWPQKQEHKGNYVSSFM